MNKINVAEVFNCSLCQIHKDVLVICLCEVMDSMESESLREKYAELYSYNKATLSRLVNLIIKAKLPLLSKIKRTTRGSPKSGS